MGDRRLWCLCIFLALAAAPMAMTQGGQTGGIQGIVTDKSGAVVPGVTVTIKNLATAFERAVVSENNGAYAFANLNAGNYSLKAQLTGFAGYVVESVTVNVGRVTDVFIKLELAGTTETITVTGVSPLVETTKTDVGGVVDNREVEDLPLNGRNFSALTTLVPGARPTTSWDPTKTRIGAVSIAGAGGRNLNTTVDGIDNKDNTVGGWVQNVPLEGIKEFAVKTQRFSAADGRSQGGLVSIVTKSGSNDFHGSWFTLFRDKALNANDYWSKKGNQAKPEFRRWQYGGSFGGPVKKDKAFFFFTYERLQEDQFGIISPDSVSQLQAVLNSGVSFYGAKPLPLAQIPQPYRSDLWTARIDWVVNTRNNFSLSWNNSKDNTLNDQGATDGTSTNFNKNRNYLISGVWSTTISPRMVNQIVVGHSYWNNLIDSEKYTDVSVVFPTTGFGTNTNVPQQSYQKKWQVKDSLVWNKGAHNWKFGVDWIFEPLLGGFFKYNPVPSLTFFDNPTDILNNKDGLYPNGFNTPGIVNVLTATAGDPRFDNKHMIHQGAWYIQDDWRLNRKLTLNLGLRYDVDINLVGSQDTEKNRTYRILKQANHPYTNPWVARIAGDDTNNFSPRVGFAYDVTGQGRTVIRGGYGMYFDQVFLNIPLFTIQQTNDTIFGTVVDLQNTVVGSGDLATFKLNDPLPPIPGGPTSLPAGSRGRIIDPDYASPMSQQSNIGFSHQLGGSFVLDADYTHVLNIRESRRMELNPKISGGPRLLAAAFAAAGEPGALARIYGETSTNRSRYDGLNISLRKRLTHRMSFQTSYTLSKAQGWGGNSGTFGTQARYDQFNIFDPREYGPTLNDERHRFAFSGVFDLPWGFQVNPIIQIGSPRPYSAVDGSDVNLDGITNDLCVAGKDYGGGRVCPSDIHQNSLRGGYDLDGNNVSGRLFVMDLRVSKIISLAKVREGMNLSFYFESFNLTNRTNFGNEFGGFTGLAQQSSIDNSQYRVTWRPATDTYGVAVASPYQAQLGVRFNF